MDVYAKNCTFFSDARFKKIEAWKKAHETYIFIKKEIAIEFPKEERFELTTQLNRAALSVPLNIVEGCGQNTDKDFAHFLDSALGSVNEVEYCCYAAYELKYISDDNYRKI